MPSDEVTRLARKLAALPEPAMRAHKLTETILAATPDEMVPLLAEIHLRGREGGPPFDVAMLALANVLGSDALDYDLLARLYKVAKELELEALARLFFSSRQADVELDFRRAGPPRELTLGHRKWQARDTRRDVLEKLMRNPEAEVMPNLLLNPRLTERDVIAMASRRPLDPEILRYVFSSPRWIVRYPIKRTLLLNPYTPTELSLRLLSFMTQGDLRLASTLSSLDRSVREGAAAMVRRRPSARPAAPPGVVDLKQAGDPAGDAE